MEYVYEFGLFSVKDLLQKQMEKVQSGQMTTDRKALQKLAFEADNLNSCIPEIVEQYLNTLNESQVNAFLAIHKQKVVVRSRIEDCTISTSSTAQIKKSVAQMAEKTQSLLSLHDSGALDSLPPMRSYLMSFENIPGTAKHLVEKTDSASLEYLTTERLREIDESVAKVLTGIAMIISNLQKIVWQPSQNSKFQRSLQKHLAEYREHGEKTDITATRTRKVLQHEPFTKEEILIQMEHRRLFAKGVLATLPDVEDLPAIDGTNTFVHRDERDLIEQTHPPAA